MSTRDAAVALVAALGWLVARDRLLPRRRTTAEERLAGYAVALLGLALVAGSDYAATHYGLNLTRGGASAHELGLLGAVLLGGLAAGAIPAALAYRRALADGLSLRW